MVKKIIQYVDYDGVEKSEECYFNLSESELTKLDAQYDGGLRGILQKIVDSKDVREIMKMFELVLHLSYGEKSVDGKHFWKRDKEGHDLADAFEQTPAYDKLFTELLSNPEYAAKFVEGILPASNKGSKPVQVK